jgi:hypothetical protein
MDWLKKNLILAVSGVVALVVIGGAGWYLYSQIQADQEIEEQLSALRGTLKELEGKTPYPSQENLVAAEEQLGQVTNFLIKADRFFGTRSTNAPVSNTEFSSMLARTVDELKRAAQAAKVSLPTNYAFSFSAQRELMKFDMTNLTRVASQVEDVRVMSKILFDAHIYELIAIQRAPVSGDDTNAIQTKASDYLAVKRVTTNEFSMTLPYVATIRCCTPELGAALEGLGRAPYGFFVKWLKVEPGEVQPEAEPGAPQVSTGGMSPEMARRYGLGRYRQPTMDASPEAAAAAAAAAKKVGVILKEKPLKVQLMIEVIKMNRSA